MKTKKIYTAILTSLILMAFSPFSYGQDKSSYDLTFLKAKIIDTTNQKDVLVLFHVSAKNKRDWSPTLSMRLTYSFDNDPEKTVDIMKKENKISVIIYDRSIAKKDKSTYNLVKDKIDLNAKSNFLVIAFYLYDVSPIMVKKMSLTYGLWEKRHKDIRVEKKYEFEIEQ